MSTLYLVRHAQASFLAEDYDVLSEIGELQSRRLGERWAALGLELDAVYSGPRRRQRHTAEIVGEVMTAAGLPWPAITVLDALDEYHAEPMMKRFAPELASSHPHVADLVQAFTRAETSRDRARSFEHLFQAVMRLWAGDAFGAPDVESFGAFLSRAEQALDTLTATDAHGRRVAAFSSGGAIGMAVGAVVGSDGVTRLELGWTLNNCGVSEILFAPGRRTLRRYNDIAHLTDPAHWTYR